MCVCSQNNRKKIKILRKCSKMRNDFTCTLSSVVHWRSKNNIIIQYCATKIQSHSHSLTRTDYKNRSNGSISGVIIFVLQLTATLKMQFFPLIYALPRFSSFYYTLRSMFALYWFRWVKGQTRWRIRFSINSYSQHHSWLCASLRCYSCIAFMSTCEFSRFSVCSPFLRLYTFFSNFIFTR